MGGETHSKRTFEFRNDSVIFPERIQLRERLFQQPLNEYIYVIIVVVIIIMISIIIIGSNSRNIHLKCLHGIS